MKTIWVVALFDDDTLIMQEMKRPFPLCLVDFGECNHEAIEERGLHSIYHTSDPQFAMTEAANVLLSLKYDEVPF
jgi:hypothetical protein